MRIFYIFFIFFLCYNKSVFALEEIIFSDEKIIFNNLDGFYLSLSDNSIKSAWFYRVYMEHLYASSVKMDNIEFKNNLNVFKVAISWAISKRKDKVNWYVFNGGLDGDPNVNRFVLLPLLELLYRFDSLGIRDVDFDEIKKQVKLSIDYQIKIYTNLILGADNNDSVDMIYPNQDLYYAIIMQLSGRVYKEKKYQEQAARAINAIYNRKIANGSFNYIANENPSPIYQGLMQVLLARYYKITNDKKVYALLLYACSYWRYAMTDNGIAEAWSDVWWKQGWLRIPAAPLKIAAIITNDINIIHKYQVLSNACCLNDDVLWDAYASEWTETNIKNVDHAYVSASYFIKDEGIRGVRQKLDNFYFGITQGGGLRNSFVGGLITGNEGVSNLGILRGVQIDVLRSEKDKHGWWLSQPKDNSLLSVKKDYAIFNVSYLLQQTVINSKLSLPTLDSPFLVSQTWSVSQIGLIGQIRLDVLQDTHAELLLLKILLGMQTINQVDSSSWLSGEIKIVAYDTIGSVEFKEVPSEYHSLVDEWKGIILKERFLSGNPKKGDFLNYIFWIGRKDMKQPSDIQVTSRGISIKINNELVNYFY